MIAQFPILYPDEDFRSIVYRYHVLSGNKNLSDTNIDLFNRKSYKNTVFPRNLSYLIDRVPSNFISVERLLHNHTYFCWLKPFVPTERFASIMDEIMFNKGESNIASLLGKERGRLLVEDYRYCPVCIANDNKSYGEVYLHRKHQLSLLKCCPEHGYELLTHCPNCGEKFESRLVTSSICMCGFDISETDIGEQYFDNIKPEQEILQNFEQLAKYSKELHLEDILFKMKNILGLKGYMKYSGRIDRKRLIEDFKNYLVDNNYNQFLDVNVNSQMKTDAFILIGNQVKSIIFYVLFMMFLSGSVEEFLIDNSAFSIPIPFGNGPWNCPNSVCPVFNQPIIRKCIRVDHQGKYISGLFGCPSCGFSFAKRWKLKDQGKERPYAVLTMGHLWNSILIDLHSSGLSNTQIAKYLHSSPGQIKVALSRMQEPRSDKRIFQALNILWSSLNLNCEVASTSEAAGQPNENRARIIELLRKNVGITRTELARKHSHLYHKMLREDREWMEQVLPTSKKNKVRIDWERLDNQYSNDVVVAADELYRRNPSEQIKKYTILAHAPKTTKEHIENAPEKLPKTIELLKSRVETDEQYLLRHLPVIISQMKKYNKKVTSLENIKTFSPMYRKSTEELDEQLTNQLNDLL
ncbi:TnsD family Tn7-like transposition protein [Brevibacillus parabrevis]|uniref:TnsD family Tn7-like transposition protein n=1 Tax=Brevibacillus parabrevis TaxID=54914 RepID=UPI002E24D303|nr:TnsD family Tn7-like transposition protein [Brevibacillus parabrevis]